MTYIEECVYDFYIVCVNYREEDEWFEAALDCLECLAEGSDILDISLTEESEISQKLRIYSFLAEYYKSCKEPLWSDEFADLHVALYGLIMQDRCDVVLQALKLAVILLPRSIREQLRRLLAFIKLASNESAIKLCVNVSKDTQRGKRKIHYAQNDV